MSYESPRQPDHRAIEEALVLISFHKAVGVAGKITNWFLRNSEGQAENDSNTPVDTDTIPLPPLSTEALTAGSIIVPTTTLVMYTARAEALLTEEQRGIDTITDANVRERALGQLMNIGVASLTLKARAPEAQQFISFNDLNLALMYQALTRESERLTDIDQQLVLQNEITAAAHLAAEAYAIASLDH